MNNTQQIKVASTITQLFEDSKYDHLKMMRAAAKSIFRPMQPSDFENAYLSISEEQGERLKQLILDNNLKNMVEFGTSFGISTLYLAAGALENGGNIVTTELIESKAIKARENFVKAGVSDLIEIRVGNAMQTLKDYESPIDFLLLDGWKDLYSPLFNLLEPNFHENTIVYVDNADMSESRLFLAQLALNNKYDVQYDFHGKVALIRVNR